MKRAILIAACLSTPVFAQQPAPPTLEQMQEQLENVVYERNALQNRVIELSRALKEANKKAECKPEAEKQK